MERDTHKEELPPPTQEELTVIERILSRCVHFTTTRSVVRRIEMSNCIACGESMSLRIEGDGDPVSPVEEATRWRARLPRPATHLVVAKQALAHVTRSGWNVQFRQTPNSCVCILARDDRVVRSRSHQNRAAAIVDALAQMAAEYRFIG